MYKFDLVIGVLLLVFWRHILKLASAEGLLINDLPKITIYSLKLDILPNLLILIILVNIGLCLVYKNLRSFFIFNIKYIVLCAVFLMGIQYYRRIFLYNLSLTPSGMAWVAVVFLLLLWITARLQFRPFYQSFKTDWSTIEGVLYRLNEPLSASLKIINIFLLLIVLIFTLQFALSISNANDPFAAYAVEDWLINYSGGFIRRAIPGSLLLLLSKLVDIRPELMVFYLKLVCYCIIYIGIVWTITLIRMTKVDMIIIMSPATYLFPVLDLPGGGRKEIILLAGLTILVIMALKNKKLCSPSILSVLLLAMTATHEGLIFFYPLILTALPIIFSLSPYHPKEMIRILLPSAVLMMIFVVSGSTGTATIIMLTKAIDPINYQLWMRGGTLALGMSALDGLRAVWDWFSLIGILSTAIALILFMIPFYLSNNAKLAGAILAAHKSRLTMAFLVQVPLFMVALDWGRWLYINASILTLVYLSVRARQDHRFEILREATADNLSTRNTINLLSLILVLIVATTSWRLEHCCVSGAAWGPLKSVMHSLIVP
jgi:hypothetical protein